MPYIKIANTFIAFTQCQHNSGSFASSNSFNPHNQAGYVLLLWKMKVKHGKVKEIAHVYTVGKEERARIHPPAVWLHALHI